MKCIFNKRKTIFFVFLTVSIGFSVVFFKFTLLDNKENNNVSLSSNIKKIKSPCREISIENKMESKKINSSQRIQKLTKLMESPIDWIFRDIYGDVIDLYCLRGKKIIIINFWATWCSPCIEELPSLSHLAKNNKDKILVLAISTEPLGTIKNFLNQSFSDLSSQLKIVQISIEEKSQYFPEDSLPVTYIFNKKGFLKVKELGAKDWSNKNLVQQIINIP